MNIQKNFMFNNTFPIHYQFSFEQKNVYDLFDKQLQYDEFLEPNEINNIG